MAVKKTLPLLIIAAASFGDFGDRISRELTQKSARAAFMAAAICAGAALCPCR